MGVTVTIDAKSAAASMNQWQMTIYIPSFSQLTVSSRGVVSAVDLFEDSRDLKDAEAALADPLNQYPVPWEEVRATQQDRRR